MIKKLACAAAILACLSPAQAAEQTYDWSFTNFLDLEGGYPVNDTIRGSFTVDDFDADGKFTASELRSFKYYFADYVSCTTCKIERFSFAPGGTLDFEIRNYQSNEWGSNSVSVNVGSSYGFFSSSSGGGEPFIDGGRWTDNTIARVTPVPEPQTYLMLGAGLLAVMGAARRRARKAA